MAAVAPGDAAGDGAGESVESGSAYATPADTAQPPMTSAAAANRAAIDAVALNPIEQQGTASVSITRDLLKRDRRGARARVRYTGVGPDGRHRSCKLAAVLYAALAAVLHEDIALAAGR
jgi:hypothetical protein